MTSSNPPIELDSNSVRDSKQGGVVASEAQVEAPPKDAPMKNLHLKLFSSGFSFFVAGTNDGSMGALLPYILRSYHIGTGLVALLYLCNFLGWLFAALSNSHLPRFLPLPSLLLLGAAFQLLSQTLRPWHPPFPLFAITFFFTGLGQAYQDSHANTFVSSVSAHAHRWLGFIHAMYGLGCLVSPFVATAVASSTSNSRWTLFYLFPMGLSMLNVSLVIVAFWGEIGLVKRGQVEGEGRSRLAMKEVRMMMKVRNIWLISLFFFFHLGVGMTAGGWVVQYLVQVRHGNLSTMGYVPSGFYGGICLGRLLLAEPTYRYGEFRMLLLYTALCFALQLVFWLVPNIVSSAVAFCLMGFLLGPFFAAGISVASRLLPKHNQPAALGLIFVTAQAGGAIFPSLIGLIATHAGVKVLQPIVAGLIVIMGITWALVPKVSSHIE